MNGQKSSHYLGSNLIPKMIVHLRTKNWLWYTLFLGYTHHMPKIQKCADSVHFGFFCLLQLSIMWGKNYLKCKALKKINILLNMSLEVTVMNLHKVKIN